jgi:hypothetical protein
MDMSTVMDIDTDTDTEGMDLTYLMENFLISDI